MSQPWSRQWFDDCEKWRGKTLEGRYAHWCHDWDELPVDETTPEFACCLCFHCKCGIRMVPRKYEGTLHILDDVFECPKRRFWNYWKHRYINLFVSERK